MDKKKKQETTKEEIVRRSEKDLNEVGPLGPVALSTS